MNKYLGLILIIILLTSCKKNNYPSSSSPTSKKFKVENIDFEYLSSKSKIKFKSGRKNFSSVVQARIRKDSAIWLSVVPALGLEAARVLITQDTVLLINRIAKQFYAYNYEQLIATYHMPLDYNIIESLFTGNLNGPLNNMKARKKGDFFVVEEKKSPLMIRNEINRSTFKLENRYIKDLSDGKYLEINYSDFKQVNKQVIPGLIALLLTPASERDAKTEINITNLKIGIDEKRLKFPFTVSSKYERKL